MEQKMTPDQPSEEQSKRLTRVEQAKLEALKSFGCEDFASVLQSSKKVSLKKKLNVLNANNEKENKEARGKNRRSKSFQEGETVTKRQRQLTQVELATIESLKSFENNNLSDITNTSKRIVSKFLNKAPKKCNNINEDQTKEAAKISGSENIEENQQENYDSGMKTLRKLSSEMLCINNCEASLNTIPLGDKAEFGLTHQLLKLFDTNQNVLNKAKDLDSPVFKG